MKTKKMLSVLLVLCMVLAWVPVTASAEEVASGTCGKNVTWVLTEDGTLTISGSGAMKDYGPMIYVPWTERKMFITSVVIGDGVTSVGKYAFETCDNLTSVSIPDSVTSIGACAFTFCQKLTSINIPDSVTSIGDGAFFDCRSLTSIVVPDGVTSITTEAFLGCSSLTNINIPDSVTSIGMCAFAYCAGLTSIDIPASVTSIDAEAFGNCSGLESITFSGDAPEIAENAFYAVTATACYPANNDTWTEDVLQNYGGILTWVPFGSCDGAHSYETETFPATCEKGGYTEYICSFCGDWYVGDYVDVLGHNYESVVTPPTYEEQGYTTHTCTHCGDSYVDAYVDALIRHEILEGDGAEWDGESEEPISIRVDADAAKFVEIRLNGEVLDPANYTVSESDMVVALKPEYLATLNVGEYTLEIVFTDGCAEATLHITGTAVVLGDLNGDGEVDIFDANLIVAYYNGTAELDAAQQKAADVNGDGEVDIFDANLVVSYYNGTIDKFPAEE